MTTTIQPRRSRAAPAAAEAIMPERRQAAPRPFLPALAATYPAWIGCDEVGRGALCGPVVTAAVWFEPTAIPGALLGSLDDSKKLTAIQRERAYHQILTCARVSVAASSAASIDRHGIRTMTLDAMRRAVHRLDTAAPVRVDGVDIPDGLRHAAEALVKGDSLVPQIAAASIVAKVVRDRLLVMLAVRHPGYGWDRNAGYGTAEHLAALGRLGTTRHHRHSFAPVALQAARA